MSKFSLELDYTSTGFSSDVPSVSVEPDSLFLSFVVDGSTVQVYPLSLSDVGTFEKFFDYGTGSFGIEIDADCNVNFVTTFVDENYIYSAVSSDAYKYLLSRICAKNPDYCSGLCNSSSSGGISSGGFSVPSLNGNCASLLDGATVNVNGLNGDFVVEGSQFLWNDATDKQSTIIYKLSKNGVFCLVPDAYVIAKAS